MKAPPLPLQDRRLQTLLPPALYAELWINPSLATLERTFEQLRSLHYLVRGHLSRKTAESPANAGELRWQWESGTLLFSDLAGFTTLVELGAVSGREGARSLLEVINQYFAGALEIINKAGGDLLEFTGDAMLVQFPGQIDGSDTILATRTALRLQRMMHGFQTLVVAGQQHNLGMRIGIHCGRFLMADIGTPARMMPILLGQTVWAAKQAETAGQVGRVCLTEMAVQRLGDRFRYEDTFRWNTLTLEREPLKTCLLDSNTQTPSEITPVTLATELPSDITPVTLATETPLASPAISVASTAQQATNQYCFVIDDLSIEDLGEYDIALRRKRRGSSFFLGRSEQDFVHEIINLTNKISPLVNYLPDSTFQLLVESAERRQIMPRFIPLFVLFVNLIGWSNRANQVATDQVGDIIEGLAEVCARIDAIVRSCGGVLKSLTYHRYFDILIYFGYPNGHVDDASRAARVADEIRHLVLSLAPREIGGQPVKLQCQIGIAWGAVFVAEIGEPLGRRELNILGDAVNVAARLMAIAKPGQVLMTAAVHEAIARETSDRNSTITITSQPLGDFQLKGKAKRISVVELQSVKKW